MREYKFRFWDEDSKTMIYDLYLESEGGMKLYLCQHPKYESMQYTGLKDIKGKEIYEGDIVKATDILSDTYEIIFDDGCYFANRPYNGIELDSASIINYQVEIIGNIYENPEFMKK